MNKLVNRMEQNSRKQDRMEQDGMETGLSYETTRKEDVHNVHKHQTTGRHIAATQNRVARGRFPTLPVASIVLLLLIVVGLLRTNTIALADSGPPLTFVETILDGNSGLGGATSVAVSNDNKHVYVVGRTGDGIAVFSRDTNTGALTFVDAIFDGWGDGSGNTVDGLGGPYSIVVSPDNAHVYVAGYDDNAIAVFSRDISTGVLTFVEAIFDGGQDAAGNAVDGLYMAISVAVSNDNAHVYVAGYGDNAVAVFSRNTTTGRLTFVEAIFDGGQDADDNTVDGLDSARSVIVSPDNAHVYLTGVNDNAIVVFSRDTGTGVLTFVEVIKDDGQDAAGNTVDGLNSACSVVVSPDNAHVYVAGFDDNKIAVFSRDTSTGTLTFVEAIFDGGQDAAGNAVDGLDGTHSVVVSPDNAYVYVVGAEDHAVSAFSRDTSTGSLTFVEAIFDGGQDAAGNTVDGLDFAFWVVVSPDNANVYVAASEDSSITTFALSSDTPMPTPTPTDMPALPTPTPTDMPSGTLMTPITSVGSVEGEGDYWLDIAIDGNYAYVTDKDYGLRVINIEDPTSPYIAGGVEMYESVHEVEIVGDYAYVGNNGIRVINIEDPTNPTNVVKILSNAWMIGHYNIEIAGDYACTTSYNTLKVLDIRNPANPIEAGSMEFDHAVLDVAIAGDYAYITTSASEEYTLAVIDIRDPSSPQRIYDLSIPSLAAHITIDGDYLYIALLDYDNIIEENLWVVDISNPERPYHVGDVEEIIFPNDIAVASGYLFAPYSSGDPGVYVIDIRTPSNPTRIEAAEPETMSDPNGLAIDGNYAYVAGDTRLEVFHVFGDSTGDPSTPTPTPTDVPAQPTSTPMPTPTDVPTPTPMATSTPIPTSPPPVISQYVDVTISLYNNPTTAQQRAPYEEIIKYFADGIFEQSNGAHKLRTVTLYRNRQQFNESHIQWLETCHPNAHVGGYAHKEQYTQFGRVMRIEMCDSFGQNDFLENHAEGGYTLAHEWGHYYYALYDEYRGSQSCGGRPGMPCSSDIPVEESIMNSQWKAADGDFIWLNFSTKNTGNNAQYRMYQASGWETLARPAKLDPRSGALKNKTKRPYYPELSDVAPLAGQKSRIDLVSGHTARSNLNIVWAETTSALQNTNDITADVISLQGDHIQSPAPIQIIAMPSKDLPIAKAHVQAEYTAPDGTVQPFTLRDDGVAPDVIAHDGMYSAILGYSQDGTYKVSISFDNSSGTAEESYAGFVMSPPPPGVSIPDPEPLPVTEDFTVVAETTIEVQGTQEDDHGNTTGTASILSLDNTDVLGRIDQAGDADVYRLTTSASGNIVVRVANWALDMEPVLRIVAADGTTEVARVEYDPSVQDGYVLTSFAVSAGETFYAEVTHRDSTAIGGIYNISAGEALISEQLSITRSVYLPLITR